MTPIKIETWVFQFMPLAAYLRPVLMDCVGKVVWLVAAKEYTIGVIQYAYL